MDHLAQLRIALEKAEAKVKRLSAQADAAQREMDELATAIRVIERLNGASAPANTQNDNGQLIYGFVGVGRANAKPPKEILDALKAAGHDLGDDLVRTQLWRMAKRSELLKGNGAYWRPAISQSVKDEGGPDGANSNTEHDPFAEYGATAAKASTGWGDDLEDDVPF
jgi:chromosome segregation ATPase